MEYYSQSLALTEFGCKLLLLINSHQLGSAYFLMEFFYFELFQNFMVFVVIAVVVSFNSCIEAKDFKK